MSDDRARLAHLAPQIARAIIRDLDGQLGAVVVVLLDEIDGAIAMSAACETGASETEEGGLRILDITQRMQPAIRAAVDEHAADHGATAVDRPDLTLHVPGERPRS